MPAETLVRVRLLSSRVGHRHDKDGRVVGQFSQAVGQIVEMPSDEAERHIERGLAEAVTAPNNKG